MILRSLRLGEVDAWLDFMHRVFAHTDRAYFAAHIANDPWYRNTDIWVIEEDGQLVSSVHVYMREIYIAGEVIQCGGIGDVATLPAYRNRGYAGALLQAAVNYMRAQGCAVSLVFAHRSDLYVRNGWRKVPQSLFSIALASLGEAAGSTPYSVRPMQWDDSREVECVRDLSQRVSEPLCGPVLRNRKYWDHWMRHEGTGAVVAVSHADEIVAYAAQRTIRERIIVTDLG